jgi:hypothetical protein
MKTSATKTLTGHDAIRYAEIQRVTLSKFADPIEEARDGLTLREAREVAAADPSLVYVKIQIKTLDDLLLAIQRKELDDVPMDDLPTFGGEEPADTLGVFSWDETRLLISDATGTLRIRSRDAARKTHKHKAITSTTRAWSGCVAAGGDCSGAPHGNTTKRELCACGAERLVESNGGHSAASEWTEREERLSPGDGTRVQFRCDAAIRDAVLARAQRESLSERQAWEAAGREWASR